MDFDSWALGLSSPMKNKKNFFDYRKLKCPFSKYCMLIKNIYNYLSPDNARIFPPNFKNIYIAALNDSATIIGPIYLDVYLCTASCQQSYKCMNHKGPAAAVMNCEVNAE